MFTAADVEGSVLRHADQIRAQTTLDNATLLDDKGEHRAAEILRDTLE